MGVGALVALHADGLDGEEDGKGLGGKGGWWVGSRGSVGLCLGSSQERGREKNADECRGCCRACKIRLISHLPDLVVEPKLLDRLDEDLVHVAQHLEAVALGDVALWWWWWGVMFMFMLVLVLMLMRSDQGVCGRKG